MHTRFVFALSTCLLGALIEPAHAQPAGGQREIQQLCAKWNDTIVVSTRPKARLTCEKIREQFEMFAKKGTLFKNIKTMVFSVRNNDLREIRPTDFPKDQKCVITKGQKIVVNCKTLDFEPEISTQLFGSQAGRLQKAIVTADLDWFKADLVRQISTSYGVPPTDNFLDFSVDLMISVSSYLGGADEQYAQSGKLLICTIRVK